MSKLFYIKEEPRITIENRSLLDTDIQIKADLVLTSGVLIHIAPEKLDRAYHRIYMASNTYIALLEYYNPTPLEVPYATPKAFAQSLAPAINACANRTKKCIKQRDSGHKWMKVQWHAILSL